MIFIKITLLISYQLTPSIRKRLFSSSSSIFAGARLLEDQTDILSAYTLNPSPRKKRISKKETSDYSRDSSDEEEEASDYSRDSSDEEEEAASVVESTYNHKGRVLRKSLRSRRSPKSLRSRRSPKSLRSRRSPKFLRSPKFTANAKLHSAMDANWERWNSIDSKKDKRAFERTLAKAAQIAAFAKQPLPDYSYPYRHVDKWNDSESCGPLEEEASDYSRDFFDEEEEASDYSRYSSDEEEEASDYSRDSSDEEEEASDYSRDSSDEEEEASDYSRDSSDEEEEAASVVESSYDHKICVDSEEGSISIPVRYIDPELPQKRKGRTVPRRELEWWEVEEEDIDPVISLYRLPEGDSNPILRNYMESYNTLSLEVETKRLQEIARRPAGEASGYYDYHEEDDATNVSTIKRRNTKNSKVLKFDFGVFCEAHPALRQYMDAYKKRKESLEILEKERASELESIWGEALPEETDFPRKSESLEAAIARRHQSLLEQKREQEQKRKQECEREQEQEREQEREQEQERAREREKRSSLPSLKHIWGSRYFPREKPDSDNNYVCGWEDAEGNIVDASSVDPNLLHEAWLVKKALRERKKLNNLERIATKERRLNKYMKLIRNEDFKEQREYFSHYKNRYVESLLKDSLKLIVEKQTTEYNLLLQTQNKVRRALWREFYNMHFNKLLDHVSALDLEEEKCKREEKLLEYQEKQRNQLLLKHRLEKYLTFKWTLKHIALEDLISERKYFPC